ncbi:MAG: SDR family NAD(P)-dependent oxidoreductase [Acetobacteraceae bacterium]|nr:SDR family NAD(P)-dependent oxidoreductase [Acetobacteraceae bacterium]
MSSNDTVSGLKGKVALITGAGGMKGVGRAIALKFARLGVDLALSDVKLKTEDLHPNQVRTGWRGLESVAEEVRAFGVRCLTITCDLSDSEQVRTLVKQTVDHFGHIDILVNNARAIVGKDKVPITELSEEVWEHFLTLNLTAPFILTKMAAQEMIRQGKGGRIINIGSDTSKRATAMGAAYGSSKQGLVGLTQAAAQDLAPYGITVNCPCPGNINTDRLSYWERAQAEAKGVSYEEFRATIIKQGEDATPMGRIAEPDDVANLVVFLASDEASFITGQAYNVNGGLLFN